MKYSSSIPIALFSISVLMLSSSGGGKRTRTADILLAKQALYQLSYTPNFISFLISGPSWT
jgi:hypothetical protein